MKRVRGQATVEYAVIIAVIIAALLAMQVYMKRGVQGKLRDATDQVGEQFNPLNTSGTWTYHSQANRTETQETSGKSTSRLNAVELQQKSGGETVTTSGDSKKVFNDTGS